MPDDDGGRGEPGAGEEGALRNDATPRVKETDLHGQRKGEFRIIQENQILSFLDNGKHC